MKEHIGIPDVVLLPLDVSKCVFHLGRPAAALLANKYPEAYLLPYHYGTFDNGVPGTGRRRSSACIEKRESWRRKSSDRRARMSVTIRAGKLVK